MSANVCIPGISGRMGLEITKVLLENSNLHLSSGVVRNINQIPKKWIYWILIKISYHLIYQNL